MVVVTAVGDAPYIINADMGVLVPPHNSTALAQGLCIVLAAPNCLTLLGQNARAYILKHHDPLHWIDQILGLCSEITRANAPVRARGEVHA